MDCLPAQCNLANQDRILANTDQPADDWIGCDIGTKKPLRRRNATSGTARVQRRQVADC